MFYWYVQDLHIAIQLQLQLGAFFNRVGGSAPHINIYLYLCVFIIIIYVFNALMCGALPPTLERNTLPAETLHPKVNIQGGALAIFFEFWSKGEHPYSAYVLSTFGILLIHFRCILGAGAP